ncbi:DUF1549 and DUF1553 domain-containing protein [Verrucomicrobiales bacterium]|nr:DUF1549 and DUF1553 domain-containing protein [Verrucomicrobiales bacterium]MDC0314292.1 DUF1549 and DUF1553 domain-containing protein [bacterium]
MKFAALTIFFTVVLTLVATAQEKPKPSLAWQRIDALIEAGYKEHNIEPNPVASDEVFVRRIYLDIIGRIPTKKETLEFINSNAKNKKTVLINELLNSEGYVSNHFNYWADILRARTQINGNGQGTPAGNAYGKWIKDSLRENKPYDQFVSEMISAKGSSWDNGAVGYYLRDYGMPLDNLAITAQVFLGTEIVCAQCHNHPFDKWTQMDYYKLAAFTYGKVTTNNSPNQQGALAAYSKGNMMMSGKAKGKKKTKGEDSHMRDVRKAFSEILKPVRFNNVVDATRSLRLPSDYQYDDAKPKSVVKPGTLFGSDAPVSDAAPPSLAFAEWVTSEKNERFTTVITNRLWKKALGVGIIEPVDNITDHTTPSNPELLAYLEGRMRAFDYDMKKFLRMIYNTKTYQREASSEESQMGVAYHFPGPVLRRMTAEQIWDSMVAMAVPNPDGPSLEHELFAKKRITEVQLIAEAVYDQSPKQFLRNGTEIANVQKKLAKEIDAAREELTAARESKDEKRIRKAIADAGAMRRQLVKEIEERVYREGLEKKIELVAMKDSDQSSQAFLAELAEMVTEGDREVSEGMSEVIGDVRPNSGIIRQLVTAMMKDDYAALKKQNAERSAREIENWKIDTKVERKSYESFNSIRKKLVRASDLPSPSPVGHFLRSFGQSDREMVENANDEASITQALALLNGPAIGGITSRYSVLVRDMSGEKMLDRLETIFLTMLSRKPRPDESKIFQAAWKADPEAGTVQGIVWTVLNMRQFLFVE